VTEPLGQGLGSVGTSSVAGASGSTTTLDNGYLARFLELGFWGFGAYAIAVCTAFWGTLSSFRKTPITDKLQSSVFAMTLAVQCMFLGLELSSDAHNSLLGVMFWATLFFTSRAGEPRAVRSGALMTSLFSSNRPAATS
jgi:O-antigen ligase